MKTRLIASAAVALIAASFASAQPVMSVGTPGSGTPTQSTGAGGATVGAPTQNNTAAAPVRSIGSAGQGRGAGASATPIGAITARTAASSSESAIKLAAAGSSVTVGGPVKVIAVLPEGAAAATVKEGTTPSSQGPAPKN